MSPVSPDQPDAAIMRCPDCGAWVDTESAGFTIYGCVACVLIETQRVRDKWNRW